MDAGLENFIAQELQKLGWRYIEPEGMKLKRRENFEEPLVIVELRNALRRINGDVELT